MKGKKIDKKIKKAAKKWAKKNPNGLDINLNTYVNGKTYYIRIWREDFGDYPHISAGV